MMKNCNQNGLVHYSTTTAAPLQGRLASILNYYFSSERDLIFVS